MLHLESLYKIPRCFDELSRFECSSKFVSFQMLVGLSHHLIIIQLLILYLDWMNSSYMEVRSKILA